MRVAELLAKDSENLYKSWNESYNGGKAFKDTFREHNNSSYPSALSCIDEILAGCETIANEVGEQKIGSPYQQYKNGNHEGALYAVESWYSWHSRDDYSNNIVSIRNSYFGSLDNKVADNSIAGLTAELNPELDSKVKASIEKTYNAILSIPQPFRNNIVCAESEAAMAACDELKNIFANELRPFFSGLDASHDAKLDAIVANYVDNVVLPTYSLLKERNAQLLSAVKTLAASPSDTNFSKACDAWLSSREPWEESEAFSSALLTLLASIPTWTAGLSIRTPSSTSSNQAISTTCFGMMMKARKRLKLHRISEVSILSNSFSSKTGNRER